MNDEATVNAGDIARLVDVGRAAVSNWRRRYEDFPRPVGGTATSPLFSLREVEDWLRRNGKTFEVGLADRVWQRLRTAGDDLRLGAMVAGAGAVLLDGESSEITDSGLRELLGQLAAELGPAEAFEFLCARYVEAHSRQLVVTPRPVAGAMARLANPDGGSLLDPACGLGTVLLAGPTTMALGQEADPTAAAIARTRLRLTGVETSIVAGDSLRAPGHPEPVDAVACEPPFNERAWGHAELTGDPRWEYGLPPKGEPELAWVQHCLAHVKPGGLVAILMPGAAASRRAGRRIRGNLLRAGALRAIASIGTTDLWLLRRPEPGDRPASTVLLVTAGIEIAEPSLRAHLDGREPAEGTAVPVIDLLDDDIDVSPARHQRSGAGRDIAVEYRAAAERFRRIAVAPPGFTALEPRHEPPATTIGELLRAGLLAITTAAARMVGDTGDVPVLTGEDLAEGREPTGRTTPSDDLIELVPGDVAVSPLGPARVVRAEGAVLGPHLARYRPDPARLDPEFLAGVLRFADTTTTGSSRFDRRRTRLPRLPLAEQREYGRAFAELVALQDAAREAATVGETLVRLGFDGLVGGQLGPAG